MRRREPHRISDLGAIAGPSPVPEKVLEHLQLARVVLHAYKALCYTAVDQDVDRPVGGAQ